MFGGKGWPPPRPHLLRSPMSVHFSARGRARSNQPPNAGFCTHVSAPLHEECLKQGLVEQRTSGHKMQQDAQANAVTKLSKPTALEGEVWWQAGLTAETGTSTASRAPSIGLLRWWNTAPRTQGWPAGPLEHAASAFTGVITYQDSKVRFALDAGKSMDRRGSKAGARAITINLLKAYHTRSDCGSDEAGGRCLRARRTLLGSSMLARLLKWGLSERTCMLAPSRNEGGLGLVNGSWISQMGSIPYNINLLQTMEVDGGVSPKGQ